MLIIKVKEGEKIDFALRRWKNKVRNVKQLDELRKRKKYTKKSALKREQKLKAIYLQVKKNAEES